MNGTREFENQKVSDIAEDSAKEFCCEILSYKSNALFFLMLKHKFKHIILDYLSLPWSDILS